MTFGRLRAADWVAMLAALALLLLMAADWYSTGVGQEARRIEGLSQPSPGQPNEVERQVHEDARNAAEVNERNAWQVEGAIDRVILGVLLLAAGLAVLAGFLRAAGRRFEAAFTPSALAALAASIGALLVIYRIVQQPGVDERTTVEVGAPLALVALALMTFTSATALRAEEEGRQFRELPDEGEPQREGAAT